MLTADLVRASRRAEQLHVSKLTGKTRARAVELADDMLRTVREHVGCTRAEVEEALAASPVASKERKLADGLAKLVEDASDFGADSDLDPTGLRRDVFLRASRARQSAEGGFDRIAVIEAVAKERELAVAELERGLYGDLKSAQELRGVESLDAEALVARYEVAQVQAVLLRATRVVAEVHCASPSAFRSLFRKLRFRRLLFEVEPLDGDFFRLTIDGPFSLFSSVTKYGLALALVFPELLQCGDLRLTADVRWGKQRTPLVFRFEHTTEDAASSVEAPLPDEVQALLDAFQKPVGGWTAARTSKLLNLPGVGLSVPDLVFRRGDADPPIHLEVLGFWSRETVWKRIELVEKGLSDRILFAVSSRLRVSQDLLDDTDSAALYVFKGTMSPKAVVRRLEQILNRSST